MRIDIATTEKLITNYKQNHWPVINGGCPSLHHNQAFPAVEDSRCAWFSLDDLNAFISAISKAGGNGIRFYFGEYSADIVNSLVAQLPNPGIPANIAQYTGLQTIVLVPTTLNATNANNDDFNLITGNSTFSNPTDLIAEDHSSIIPPPWVAANYFSATGAYFLDL